MDRKVDMTELYLDFKDDGIINKDKFAKVNLNLALEILKFENSKLNSFQNNYDPFFESPDTPTQLGTCVIITKPLSLLTTIKTQAKIIDMRSNEAGRLSVEVTPCNGKLILI